MIWCHLINPHRPVTLDDVVSYEGHSFYYNNSHEIIGDIDCVVDIGVLFSPQSRSYDRSQRGLVIIEPLGQRKLFHNMCIAHAPDMAENFLSDDLGTMVSKLSDYYGFLICWWHDCVRHLPQYRPFTWSFTFVKNIGPRNKRFGLSGVISSKKSPNFPGYVMRQEFLNRQFEITVPGIIYNHKGSWQNLKHDYPIETKDPAFAWTHHVAIENCVEDGYFSEKLLDCFVTHTIPIYYGHKSTVELFDSNGIIIINTIDELVDVVNSITPQQYLSKIESIHNNYNLAMEWVDPDQRLFKIIIDAATRL